MNSKQISYLRGLAHNLNPVVMISNKGLSEAVLKEINLNLDAHELIKIKVAGDDIGHSGLRGHDNRGQVAHRIGGHRPLPLGVFNEARQLRHCLPLSESP